MRHEQEEQQLQTRDGNISQGLYSHTQRILPITRTHMVKVIFNELLLSGNYILVSW